LTVAPALSRGLKKFARTVVQLIVSGGLTAAVNEFANGLDPQTQIYVLAGWTALVTLIQNTLETKGLIPTLFPAPGLVTTTAGGILTKTVGTVDTTVDTVQGVVTEVVDTAGKAVGGVVGTLDARGARRFGGGGGAVSDPGPMSGPSDPVTDPDDPRQVGGI
jgi:hypothetical protein